MRLHDSSFLAEEEQLLNVLWLREVIDCSCFVCTPQLCSMLCIAHCAFWGIYYWFAEAGTIEDRLYGSTVGAVVIGRVKLQQLPFVVLVVLSCILRLLVFVGGSVFGAVAAVATAA